MTRKARGLVRRIGDGARLTSIAAIAVACGGAATHEHERLSESDNLGAGGSAVVTNDSASATGGRSSVGGDRWIGGDSPSGADRPMGGHGSIGGDSSDGDSFVGASLPAGVGGADSGTVGATATPTGSATSTSVSSTTGASGLTSTTSTGTPAPSTSGGTGSVCVFDECSFDDGSVFE